MKRLLLILISALFVLIIAVGGVVYWKYNTALNQTLQITSEQSINVPKGATPNMMFNVLEEKGIINDAFFLRLYWRLENKGKSIHAGEYLLKPGMTIQSVVDIWLRGDVILHRVTLVDGWNFKQVRAALAKQDTLEHTITDMSDQDIMQALDEKDLHPEGQFFADTYTYMKGDTDLTILRQAHKRLLTELDEEWAYKADDLPYENAYQALIMASIIEKETGVPDERPMIAGVFVRRLEKNMLLQTDPTVIYGMGDRYNGRITRADLKQATPYNTYVISGLPPTPIAIVGKEAIHAALHPADGDYLYFVAKGDGSHEFSKNLIDHQKAVREYQLKRRADYRSSPAPSTAN